MRKMYHFIFVRTKTVRDTYFKTFSKLSVTFSYSFYALSVHTIVANYFVLVIEAYISVLRVD